MKYFAYGSNMDKNDLDEWCRRNNRTFIHFKEIIPVKLNDYRLAFNYYSSSRYGGAANIMPSKGSYVYGLLIKIKEEDLNIIRHKEGYPNYYSEIDIEVELLDGTSIRNVKSYKVKKEKEKTNHHKPTRDYMELIIKNAKRYSFPSEYISFLESFKTKT